MDDKFNNEVKIDSRSIIIYNIYKDIVYNDRYISIIGGVKNV